jgi:hypothetical protein
VVLVSGLAVEAVPTSGTGRGYIRIGRGDTVAAVEFGIAGDLAILEGDIVLGTVAELSRTTPDAPHEYTLAPGTHDGPYPAAALRVGLGCRWPNRTIPYVIDRNLPNQQRVTEAIKLWQEKTSMQFVLRDGETNYVRFISTPDECSSWVGMKGDDQDIKLAADCDKGNVIHEIGHAVGLFHEQSRADRDTYVTFYCNNLSDCSMAINFDKLLLTKAARTGPYDYDSVMHYPEDAFAKAGTKTLVPTDPSAKIGQRTHLSRGDIAATRELTNTAIALTGGKDWTTIPVAFSHGDGKFDVKNESSPYFAQYASATSAKVFVGDFNGDGRADLALLGVGSNIWVASSNGDGTFRITNEVYSDFAPLAAETGVKVLVGDFNGDGRDDIALTGGKLKSIPIAFSDGDGKFDVKNVENKDVEYIAKYASETSAKVLVGDFNGDGRADLALLGLGSNIWVAFSKGDGNFRFTNEVYAAFARLAALPGVRVLVGDFNADGRADLVLSGGNLKTIPVAFSNGDGKFDVKNTEGADFAQHATATSEKLLVGDFNGDGRADLAFVGAGTSILVALSNGDGTFNITKVVYGEFAAWAGEAGVKILVGDFNGNGLDDIALTGGSHWKTIPVAFSKGNGSFDVTNERYLDFASRAAQQGVTAVAAQLS